MLIRSQDKKSLCNYNGGIVTAFEKYDHDIINNKMVPTEIKGYNIFFCDQSREIQIGEYSTEEKAIKVLDMIQEEYQRINIKGQRDAIDFKKKVFQMPQDSEVKV